MNARHNPVTARRHRRYHLARSHQKWAKTSVRRGEQSAASSQSLPGWVDTPCHRRLLAFLAKPWRRASLVVEGQLATGQQADPPGQTRIELADVVPFDSRTPRKVEIVRLLSQTATPDATVSFLRGLASLSGGQPTTIC